MRILPTPLQTSCKYGPFVVAEVGRVVLEAGAAGAELRGRVGALGRGGRVGEHDSVAAAIALGSFPGIAAFAAVAAVLLPFGCGLSSSGLNWLLEKT